MAEEVLEAPGSPGNVIPGIPTIVFNVQSSSNHQNQGVSAMKQTAHLAAIQEESDHAPMVAEVLRKVRNLVKQRINSMRAQNQISPFFVSPRLVATDFYAGETWHQYEEQNLAHHKKIMCLPDQTTTSYSEVFKSSTANGQGHRFVSLLGHPGCGCTTVSLKFADELLAGRSPTPVVLVYNFHRMLHVGTERMTLQELLLDRAFPGLARAESDTIYRWMRDNQSRCTLVIDRFNDNRLMIDHSSSNQDVGYDTKHTVSGLFAALLAGKLLPNVRILTASRPNCVLSLTGDLRPDVTYLMYGFDEESVHTLWTNLVGRNSKQLWAELRRKCSLVLAIMPGSPFIMHTAALAIEAGCSTTAQIYCYMYKHYVRSTHCDLKPVMVDRLRLLAFEGKCVPLSALSMSVDDVKDFMVALPVRRDRRAGRLGEHDIRLYFIHIIVKEYLAAEHMLLSMACDEFAAYLAAGMRKRRCLHLFVCSLLLDTQVETEFPVDERKKQIFCDHVLGICKSATVPLYGTCRVPNQLDAAKRDEYISVLEVAREGNSAELTRSLAAVFPDHADFSDRVFTESEIHSLCRLLGRCEKFVQRLVFRRCRLTSSGVGYLTNAIAHMPGMVVILDLSDNRLTTKEVSLLCRCIGKLERSLILKSCFYDKHDKIRPFSDDERFLLKSAISDSGSGVNVVGD